MCDSIYPVRAGHSLLLFDYLGHQLCSVYCLLITGSRLGAFAPSVYRSKCPDMVAAFSINDPCAGSSHHMYVKPLAWALHRKHFDHEYDFFEELKLRYGIH